MGSRTLSSLPWKRNRKQLKWALPLHFTSTPLWVEVKEVPEVLVEGSDFERRRNVSGPISRSLTPLRRPRRLRLLCQRGKEVKKEMNHLPSFLPSGTRQRSLAEKARKIMNLLKKITSGACRAESEVAPPGGLLGGVVLTPPRSYARQEVC